MSKKKQPDSKPTVPSYIVTFSDMVTLLLTFFVLLLSMANTQDEAKFNQGQESIKKAIATLGMAGFLAGKESISQYDYTPVHFTVDMQSSKKEDLELEEQIDTLKRTVHILEKMVTISPSSIVGEHPIFGTAGASFETATAKITADSEKKLNQYCRDLSSSLPTDRTITMYIVGFCTDTMDDNQNRMISTKRAAFTCNYIKENLPESPYWNFYYWGAGNGGDWVNEDNAMDANSQVTIAIITPN